MNNNESINLYNKKVKLFINLTKESRIIIGNESLLLLEILVIVS